MPETNINWQRFWIPRGTSVDLDYGAYLPDPTSEEGKRRNPGVVPASHFDGKGCVVLLGETALGKTTAVMQVERAETERRVTNQPGQIIWESLGGYSSDTTLIAEVFQSEALRQLSLDGPPLFLFLDDFEECLARIPALPALIERQLGRFDAHLLQQRLRLRILCRSSVWPEPLSKALKRIWGEEGVSAFELAPLRLEDVLHAATDREVDPLAFMQEVERHRLHGSAARPFVLLTLLRKFSVHEPLPTTQEAVYEDVCSYLCAAFDPDRGQGGRQGRLNVQGRLEIADRMAAAMMFTGREFVAKDWPEAGSRSDRVELFDLVGEEILNGRMSIVGESEIREVLETGLFASADDLGRLRWSHRSYAEYLAARYLKRKQTKLSQVRSLIVHPEDITGGIVPALHETAAWLATMRDDVFSDIANRDPIVLLTSDAVEGDEQFRARLVDQLLNRYDESSLLPPDLFVRKRFAKLNHGGIANQLTEWILDRSRRTEARRIAIDIAETCEVVGALPAMVQTALAVEDDFEVRVRAAYAIVESEHRESMDALLPLLEDGTVDDRSQLKGLALQATWPTSLIATRLFEVLTPATSNFLGAYKSFLYRDPIRHLNFADVPIALSWVDKQLDLHELNYDFEILVNSIIERSIYFIDEPEVADALAPTVWKRIQKEHGIFGRSMYESLGGPRKSLIVDQRRRRKLFEFLLARYGNEADFASEVRYAELILADDVIWLLAKYEREVEVSIQRSLARLVGLSLRADRVEEIAAVAEMRERHQVLRDETARAFAYLEDAAPPEPNAEEDQPFEIEDEETTAPLIPRGERIAEELDRFLGGDTSAFWRLTLFLAIKDDGHWLGDEREPDLTATQAWPTLSEEAQQSVIDYGYEYLQEATPAPAEWVNTDVIYRPDWAAFKSFFLLWRTSDDRLNEIPNEIWSKWAMVIVAFPTPRGTGDVDAQRALVRLAYASAPQEVLDAVEQQVGVDDAVYSRDVRSVLERLDEAWDEEIAAAVLRGIAASNPSAAKAGEVIRYLLLRGNLEAEGLAKQWIRGAHGNGDERDLALQGAHALVTSTEGGGWSDVWPIIESDAGFGQELFARISWSHDRIDFAAKLGAHRAMALFAWLEQNFPSEADPVHEGVHEVTDRDQIIWIRDGLLSDIANLRSPDAVEALRELSTVMPLHQGVEFAYLRSRELARPTDWTAPSPREILQLVARSELRLVQNTEQLRDVVVESVARLQDRLQEAESRAVSDLWNITSRSNLRGVTKTTLTEVRKKIPRDQRVLRERLWIANFWKAHKDLYSVVMSPKGEILLSDYTKRFLDDDLNRRGLIVNREVQNRPGDIVDLRVQAIPRLERGAIANGQIDTALTLVIEVKGCWNPDLESAMESQLADRYLRALGARFGIYLVFWFDPEPWDSNDRRQVRTRRYTRDDVTKRLNEQAAQLRKRGLDIVTIVVDASLPVDIALTDEEIGLEIENDNQAAAQ